MKKYGIYILIVGIILVLVPILFPNILKSNKNTNGDNPNDNTNTKWVVLYGAELSGEYSLYNSEEYYENYFYSINETENKYIFSIPKDETLTRIAYYANYYTGNVIIEYADSEFTDINKYVNEYVDQYSNNFDKIYIRKMVVDDNEFALDIRAINKSTNTSFEELKILYKNTDSNYSYVKYQIQGSMFADEFIDKMIDSFKKDDKKANYTTCNLSNNKYSCKIQINSINKTISFTVDANKYVLKDNTMYNNYQEVFNNVLPDNIDEDTENVLEQHIYVSFVLSNNLETSLNENERLNLNNAKDITISGKTIKKYNLSNENANRANYLINLSDNLSVFVDIESTQNNLDDTLKDFMNFELKNN
jgi:hypothetical protein